MSMVTMSDVAVRAGVSQATVSFVLAGRAEHHKISGDTRDRVLRTARELGYQRNQLARAMVTGKSRIIGVLTTVQSGDNVLRILTGAMEAASANNYLLKVIHLSFTTIDEATIARCLEWRLAGVMVVGLNEESHRTINEAFQGNNIPVALVDNVPPVNWAIRVASDDAQGIRQVVAHLTGLGHRRIAFIGGKNSPITEWREQSFRAALAESGLSAPAHWIRQTSWSDQPVIEAGVRALFAESEDCLPTAIACSSDAIAMVVLRNARAMGLRLPVDLSVTGYSNAALAAFADPPITTVDQSFHELGVAAAMRLIRLSEGGDVSQPEASGEMLLPTHLIERGSTAPPPIG